MSKRYPTHRNNRSSRTGLVFILVTAATAIISFLLSRDSFWNFLRTFLILFFTLHLFALLVRYYARYVRKNSKKTVPRKQSHAARQAQSGVAPSDTYTRSYTNKKPNFNWSGEDVCRNEREQAAPSPLPEESYRKPVETAEKRKYFPYRSPFDPIRPRTQEDTTPSPVSPDIGAADVPPVSAQPGIDERENFQELIEDSIGTAPAIWMEDGMEEDDIDVLMPEDQKYSPIDLNATLYPEEEAACGIEMYVPPMEDEAESLAASQELSFPEEEEAFDNPASAPVQQEEPRKVVKVVFKNRPAGPVPFVAKAKTQEISAGEIKSASPPTSENLPEELPPVELLNDSGEREYEPEDDFIDANAKKLVDTLASFGVGAKILNVSQGPSVTRYELQPNAGVKVSKIVNLADDIALNLAATGVRIEAPIPGKAAVGIEVPNKEVIPVLLREVIQSPEFQNHPSKLAFAVGKDVAGQTIVGDIAKMPHLLIAGATGSGKSVCINTLIASILFKASPAEVKLLMVDPKVVELGIYNGIPHLLIPVVTDPKKAAGALSWAVVEMTNRYKLFAENNVRDLRGYNVHAKQRGEAALPQIVIIIDELADLMMVAPNDVEDCICRLAQMARAAGMHLVIATQRPSVDVITGVIKANIPSRIAFAVSSQIDSRTILDMAGAEKLLGRGDMLFNPIGEPKPVRVQGGFISDHEVEVIVSHLKASYTVQYDEDILEKINSQGEAQKAEENGGDEDELFQQAVDIVMEQGQASVSLLQRKLKIGYSRAARIIDQMEAWGIIGGFDGSKPRQILISKSEWHELNS